MTYLSKRYVCAIKKKTIKSCSTGCGTPLQEGGDWRKTLTIHEKMADIVKRRQCGRVEATSLAARALVAWRERNAARALLKRIEDEEFPKKVHYDFLARAFMDLRNYNEVIRCCERAVRLGEAENAK
jgi:hypothetical protein